MENFINEQGNSEEINESNIDHLVYLKDAFSEKIVDLTAKENAIEDCLVAMKKAFEKDQLSLSDFLNNIRKMTNK